MTNIAFPDVPLLKALVVEAKRIHEDAQFCCAGHTYEARHWERVHLWLGIPATLMAAVAGVTSLVGQNSIANQFKWETELIAGVLALLVATLTGLATFLDPKGQAMKHYEASNSYLALMNETRFFYEISCREVCDERDLDTKLRKLSSRLSDLNKHTPLISDNAKGCGNRSISAGNYIYQVDKQIGGQASGRR